MLFFTPCHTIGLRGILFSKPIYQSSYRLFSICLNGKSPNGSVHVGRVRFVLRHDAKIVSSKFRKMSATYETFWKACEKHYSRIRTTIYSNLESQKFMLVFQRETITTMAMAVIVSLEFPTCLFVENKQNDQQMFESSSSCLPPPPPPVIGKPSLWGRTVIVI